MSDFKVLSTRRAEIAQSMDKIERQARESETGLFSDDQRKAFDALLQQQEEVNGDLDRVTHRMELDKADTKRNRDGGVETSGRWEGREEGQLATLASTPIVYHGYDGMETMEALKTAFGAQLMDVRSAATGYGMTEPLRQIQAAAAGAGEKIGSDGGFLVQTDVGAALIREVFAGGQLLNSVRRINIGPNSNGITMRAVDETSRATGSRWGGVQGYWVDEGTAPTATNPTWRKVELKLNKVAALGYATDELMQDSVALGDIFFQAFTEELRFLVEDAIMNGTGAGQPLGILSSPAVVSVAKETGQAASTIVKKNIDKMYARRWARGTSGMNWYHNVDIEPALEDLNMTIGTGGVPVYLPPGGLVDAPNSRIKGRPAIATEYNATLGTVGDIVLADLSQYLFIAKLVQSASSMHVRFTTDEQAFRVTWRVDGRPAWVSALTPFKGTNTQSPFISLATRA